MVDSPLSYNVILGHPTLNALKAIPFTYHQKIKFETPSGIGEVLGDQAIAKQCHNLQLNEHRPVTQAMSIDHDPREGVRPTLVDNLHSITLALG